MDMILYQTPLIGLKMFGKISLRSIRPLFFSIKICWRNCLMVYLPLGILHGLHAEVGYTWEGDAISSYEPSFSPVREHTPSSTSRTPVSQVGVNSIKGERITYGSSTIRSYRVGPITDICIY
ncbi:hypothetical protein GIB67_012343 [Kingdonia uniflora]|uniref:Uncharacterized protein n=1 Tax=Kingdonia uniflora TaxID=39325 RepID=A0A7J7MVN3_9MAGN|nr:hypothetical protein GIB67_012343 [Kingdonia uniflora]